MIENKCDVKYVTTHTNKYTTRSQMGGQPERAPKGAYFHQDSPQWYKKK